MTRYYTAWLTFMVVLVFVGFIFDSDQGIFIAYIAALAAALVVYLLHPRFFNREHNQVNNNQIK